MTTIKCINVGTDPADKSVYFIVAPDDIGRDGVVDNGNGRLGLVPFWSYVSNGANPVTPITDTSFHKRFWDMKGNEEDIDKFLNRTTPLSKADLAAAGKWVVDIDVPDPTDGTADTATEPAPTRRRDPASRRSIPVDTEPAAFG